MIVKMKTLKKKEKGSAADFNESIKFLFVDFLFHTILYLSFYTLDNRNIVKFYFI